jgi:hypothetical protein
VEAGDGVAVVEVVEEGAASGGAPADGCFGGLIAGLEDVLGDLHENGVGVGKVGVGSRAFLKVWG